MREIQDMTLNVSRGLERLERRLSERLERFRQEFKYLETPEDAWGIRLTAAPVGEEIRLNRVFRQDPASQLGRLAEEFAEPWHQVLWRPQDGKYRKLEGLVSQSSLPEYWKPRLRAARAGLHFDFSRGKLYRNSYRELHCDGLVELGYVSRPSVAEGGKHRYRLLRPDLAADMFANLAVWADRVRKQAFAPTAEYALEVEICAKGGSLVVSNSDRHLHVTDDPPELPPGTTTFPQYPIGDPDEIPALISLFNRDLWNSVGEEFGARDDLFVIEGWSS